MALLPRLLLVLIAVGAVLTGIQAPGFVQHYEQRLDAHILELRHNLQPFRDIAAREHGGSLDALILHHLQSTDRSFHAEGAAIRDMRDRLDAMQREQASLAVTLPEQVWHLARSGNRELLDEARRTYTATVVLNRDALLAGAVAMAAAVLLIELLAGLFGLLRRPAAAPR